MEDKVKTTITHVDPDRTPTTQFAEAIIPEALYVQVLPKEKKEFPLEDLNQVLEKPQEGLQDELPLPSISIPPNPPIELPSNKPMTLSPRQRIAAKKHNTHPLPIITSESTLVPSPEQLGDTRNYNRTREDELSNNSAILLTKILEEQPRIAPETHCFLMDDVEHYDIEIEQVTRELEELNLRQQHAKKSSQHQIEEAETYISLHQKFRSENTHSLMQQDDIPSNPRKRRLQDQNNVKHEAYDEESSITKSEAPRKSPRKLDPINKKAEPSYAMATQSRVFFVNATSEPSHTLRAPEKPSKIPTHSPTRRATKPHRVANSESPKKLSEVSKAINAEKPTTLPPLVSPPKTNPLGVPAHILEEGGVYPWSKLMQQVIVPHGTESPVVYVPIFNPAYIAEVKKHVVEPPSPVKQTTARQKKEPPSLKSKVK
ncbi:hypothetical protein THRCLA_00837 [Thraustotheca clavata]|uniref:Uncharacterized protein n=1 Tax=Thraustotheca clavata TaxID=74557 RepID=A0A1W0AA16_9STRA|nr:hypothetical protein THRCLA_00837 [Thraustotheca clavata]